MKNRNLADVPLAQYAPRSAYRPIIGDLVVWAGWVRTWFGIVSGISNDGLQVVYEGLPVLLVTQTPEEQAKNTRLLKFDELTGAKAGVYSVLQHDTKHNAIIWYI